MIFKSMVPFSSVIGPSSALLEWTWLRIQTAPGPQITNLSKDWYEEVIIGSPKKDALKGPGMGCIGNLLVFQILDSLGKQGTLTALLTLTARILSIRIAKRPKPPSTI